jgi:DNA-directed RNA polymerase alpha subunit
MNVIVSFNYEYRFPTKDELENFNIDKLYAIAKWNDEFRQIILDFIISSGFVCNEEDTNNLFLKDIEMSTELRNLLVKSNFKTLNELSFVTRSNLRSIRGFGKKRFAELQEILSEHDLHLADAKNQI